MDGLHLAQVVFCGLVYDSRSFTVGCISGVTSIKERCGRVYSFWTFLSFHPFEASPQQRFGSSGLYAWFINIPYQARLMVRPKGSYRVSTKDALC